MKILYSCLSKSWGGMEMITLIFIKQLLKKNIKVEFLCLKESRMHIEANNLGIILHPVKAAGYVNPLISIKLASIINHGSFDLIHAQASKDLWVIVPALKILSSKIPLILTKHVGSFIVKKDWIHNFIYSRVTKAFAISSVIEKNLIETTSLTNDKIEVVFNGVDTKKFDPAKVDGNIVRKEFDVSDNEILIGMLARLSPGKGHEEFIYAADVLSKKYSNLKFIIVGEASRGEDKYAESVKTLAADKNLNNIIFTGFRNDTPNLLAALDIFVFPSHAEAFGLALIEAMAMGKPSVCSGSDGILDIAVEGETSFLFKVKDAVDLTDKIELMIIDPGKRKIFGDNAIKRVKEKFELDVITGQTIKIYSQLLKSKV